MAPRKKATKKTTAPAPKPAPRTPRVDMVDGWPYFATVDGVRMNRRQWLTATAPARKDALVAKLREAADDDADTP